MPHRTKEQQASGLRQKLTAAAQVAPHVRQPDESPDRPLYEDLSLSITLRRALYTIFWCGAAEEGATPLALRAGDLRLVRRSHLTFGVRSVTVDFPHTKSDSVLGGTVPFHPKHAFFPSLSGKTR